MIIESNFKNKSGIYCICNIKNNKRYIGSSKNIWQRLQCHRSYLRKNTHFNDHLQKAWNKHKEISFVSIVLEYCEIFDLEKREQFYIDNLTPEYNSVIDIKRPIVSDYSREKMSRTKKMLFANGTLKSLSSREIFKYSLDGKYICSYNNIQEAARSNKVNRSTIHRFLSGAYRKGGNFLWSYTKVKSLPEYVKTKKQTFRIAVEVRDYFTNELIRTFDNYVECAKFFNTHKQCIMQAIKQSSKFRKKYRLFKIPRIAGTSGSRQSAAELKE